MASLQPLLNVLEEQCNVPFSLLTRKALFSFTPKNDFQKFLLESRVMPFLRLKVLHHLARDEGCLLGYESVEYWMDVGEGEEAPETRLMAAHGPVMLDKRFPNELVFNYLLAELGFAQVLMKECAVLEDTTRVDKDGPVKAFDHWFEMPKGLIIVVPEKAVLVGEELWFDPRKFEEGFVENLVSYHQKFFADFLEKYKDDCVPHELYVDWLLGWFPGRVSVKSLEQA